MINADTILAAIDLHLKDAGIDRQQYEPKVARQINRAVLSLGNGDIETAQVLLRLAEEKAKEIEDEN